MSAMWESFNVPRPSLPTNRNYRMVNCAMTTDQKKTSNQYRCAKGRIRSLIRDGYEREEAVQIVREEQWSNSW